jgi:hypothetical protein
VVPRAPHFRSIGAIRRQDGEKREVWSSSHAFMCEAWYWYSRGAGVLLKRQHGKRTR